MVPKGEKARQIDKLNMAWPQAMQPVLLPRQWFPEIPKARSLATLNTFPCHLLRVDGTLGSLDA